MISPEFLTAGKAVFTVSDSIKKSHATFRVKSGKDKFRVKGGPETILFVGVLDGADNTRDYACIGRIIHDEFIPSKGAVGYSRQQAVFAWAYERIMGQRELPPSTTIEHAGMCCRCARLLTTPQSLLDGYGPECSKKMMKAA
jgi:hypothetical protein